MRNKPILFNTAMVRAIMEGRKTQTRRLVKTADGFPLGLFSDNVKPPICGPGDILWVRETWHKDVGRYMYRANYTENERFFRDGKEVQLRWSPSIHMPKEAARIFLRVNDLRAERLQEITPREVEREGALVINNPLIREDKDTYKAIANKAMARLWDSTIKPGDLRRSGWDANPWVWVIEFEPCEKPEDWAEG